VLTTHDYGDVEWVDIVDATDADLAEVIQRFHVHERTFDEATRRAARPTIQRFDDHAYLVAFSASLGEIDMYLGPTWLVTIRRHDDMEQEWKTAPVIERFQRQFATAPSSSMLLLTVLDVLIDGYFDRADQLEDAVEQAEEAIFGEDRPSEQSVQEQLFGLRRDLMRLRRVVSPLREVLNAIARRELPWVNDEALVLSRYLYDKTMRAVDAIDEMRELVGNAVDAHLAVMSNQMNLVMKKLTAWGSIVFGATLIAGIYGMNFNHMPELGWQYGYPMALGTMLVMSVILYRIFRSRDWL
jgi:magnesium transporter